MQRLFPWSQANNATLLKVGNTKLSLINRFSALKSTDRLGIRAEPPLVDDLIGYASPPQLEEVQTIESKYQAPLVSPRARG
jgi:hypothetical protein